jgi:hypothetical protein
MRLRTLLTGAAASAIMLTTPVAAFAATSGHGGGYGSDPVQTSPNTHQCSPGRDGGPLVQSRIHQPSCCQNRPNGLGDDSKGGREGNSCTCTPTWIFVKDPSGRGLYDQDGKYDPRHGKCDRTQQQACGCPKGITDNDGRGRGCTVTTGYPGGPGSYHPGKPCKPPVTVTNCHSHGGNHLHEV